MSTTKTFAVEAKENAIEVVITGTTDNYPTPTVVVTKDKTVVKTLKEKTDFASFDETKPNGIETMTMLINVPGPGKYNVDIDCSKEKASKTVTVE